MTLALLALLACAGHHDAPIDTPLPREVSERAPADPVQVLDDAAASLDPSLRARALSILVRADRAPAGGAWGLRAVHDPDPWVQRAAVVALAGRLDEPETRALLRDTARRDTDPYVRGAAAVRLADRGDDDLRDALSQSWRAEPRPWLRAPLALGAAVLGEADAVEALAAVIRGGQLPLEPDFVADIGHSGPNALVPALRDGEDRVEPELALSLAAARWTLGDRSAAGAFRRALRADDVGRRIEAIALLSRLPAPSTGLLRRARRGPTELERAHATLALVARGGRPVGDLVAAAKSDDREIRALAARFSARVDAPEAAAVLDAALVDDDPVVRRAALRAAVDAALPVDPDAIRAALSDDDERIRVEASALALAAARRAAGEPVRP